MGLHRGDLGFWAKDFGFKGLGYRVTVICWGYVGIMEKNMETTI